MSVLLNAYRAHSCFRYKEGKTVFGEIVEGPDPLATPTDKKIKPPPLTPFEIELNKLTFRLQQACRRGDFGDTFATGRDPENMNDSERSFCLLVLNFNLDAGFIKRQLSNLTPEQAETWLTDHEIDIVTFIGRLDDIYKHRKCSIVWLERVLNIAEPLFAVLALVGLAAGVMKVMGTGILGGTLAHYATPEATLGLMKVTGLTSLSVAAFCTLFCTEKHNLKASISESVEKRKTMG